MVNTLQQSIRATLFGLAVLLCVSFSAPAFACKYAPLGHGKKFGELYTKQLERDQKRMDKLRRDFHGGCSKKPVKIACGITTQCSKLSASQLSKLEYSDDNYRYRLSPKERQATINEMEKLTKKWRER